MSRAPVAAPTTAIANIENTTTARNTRVSPSPSQCWVITTSGSGAFCTEARSGMATVKPISATSQRPAGAT